MASLNQYSRISGKFVRNKFCGLSAFLLLASCWFPFYVPKRNSLNHTELICPNGQKILIQHSTAEEIRDGIRRHLIVKEKEGTKENYTVIRYKDGYLVQIKIPPEYLINCSIRNVRIDHVGYWYDAIY